MLLCTSDVIDRKVLFFIETVTIIAVYPNSKTLSRKFWQFLRTKANPD